MMPQMRKLLPIDILTFELIPDNYWIALHSQLLIQKLMILTEMPYFKFLLVSHYELQTCRFR
ncbi:MAG: hypothetical protein EBR82_48045 [Caulobacteraceae bacterium]|nr:hypothetical protein [Caulobacteraceae bacterium]